MTQMTGAAIGEQPQEKYPYAGTDHKGQQEAASSFQKEGLHSSGAEGLLNTNFQSNNSPLYSAISNMEKDKFNSNLYQMRKGIDNEAPIYSAQRYMRAADVKNKINELERQKKIYNAQLQASKKKSRAHLLATTGGLAGMVGGAIAGGPMGAMAGMGAGQALGVKA